MIVCPVPAYGRYPLVRLTVDRLLNVNNVDKVILIGHEPEVKKIAEDYDCEFIYHEMSLSE
jgi:phosphohistidine phosphatase SixA